MRGAANFLATRSALHLKSGPLHHPSPSIQRFLHLAGSRKRLTDPLITAISHSVRLVAPPRLAPLTTLL